jgi:uncharacterized protein involved in exopolysaccharide biosynthesis
MNNINVNNQICYEEDEIDLRELFATIWKYKLFLVIFTFFVALGALVYTLSKPNEYKVFTILAPQGEQKSISLGGLGALASIAGVNIGSSGVTPDVAFKTLIDDYEFMKNFIKNNGFDEDIVNKKLEKSYIFAFNYDGVYKFFSPNSDEDNKKIGFYEIYKMFKSRFLVSTDKKTGLITISFTHPSRYFAYDVLTQFLKDATKYLVNRNLEDINLQISRYQKELEKTNNIELKSELAKLISNLIKQKVYINSSKYYKVKVITDPYIPDVKDKVKPKRGLIVIVAFITSIILGIFIIFFIEFIRKEEK